MATSDDELDNSFVILKKNEIIGEILTDGLSALCTDIHDEDISQAIDSLISKLTIHEIKEKLAQLMRVNIFQENLKRNNSLTSTQELEYEHNSLLTTIRLVDYEKKCLLLEKEKDKALKKVIQTEKINKRLQNCIDTQLDELNVMKEKMKALELENKFLFAPLSEFESDYFILLEKEKKNP